MTPKLGLADTRTSVFYIFATSWLANISKILSRSYILITSRMKRIKLPQVFAVISHTFNMTIDARNGSINVLNNF